MGKFIDLTGKTFENLKVLKRAESRREKNGKLRTYWLCQCKCGNIIEVRADDLKEKKKKSCGCSSNFTKGKYNGLSNTKIYTAWNHILQRCYNPKEKRYKNYGGRGIKICEEWKNDFMSFYNWAIKNGYQEGLTIDRINNNGNYEPNNCRWVTDYIQRRNRTDSHYITIDNETKILTDWANTFNIKPNVVRNRIKLGWNEIDALKTPVRRR